MFTVAINDYKAVMFLVVSESSPRYLCSIENGGFLTSP